MLSGCALERWIDDVYDGDPRMTEIKDTIDNLRGNISAVAEDAKNEFKIRLNILREEAEMLGDLKQAEFELKLSEMKAQLEVIKSAVK